MKLINLYNAKSIYPQNPFEVVGYIPAVCTTAESLKSDWEK
jgi:hypothetical protein